MRICPYCDGSQMVIVVAKDENPPKNCIGGGSHLGAVVYWIVWCGHCKEEWVGVE